MGEPSKRRIKPKRTVILDDISSPFLLPDEAAKFLRLDERTLANYRTSQIGPRYRKHGGMICYHEADLIKWSATHVALM